jgi:hypothetical protein
MRARLESHYGSFICRGELIQTDYEFPSLAESLGWSLRRLQKRSNGETVILQRQPASGRGCDHRSTDGTVTCRECGVTASEFITAAGRFLDKIAE